MTARETGLYYLQSRYYNPEWGRFLNADAYVSTGQGLLGNNMFAYCNNNPVNNSDPSGEFSNNIESQFQQTYYGDGANVSGYGAASTGIIAVGFIASIVDGLWKLISKSLARAEFRKYGHSEEIHHLVAKAAPSAALAAAILYDLLPGGVENPINKISIKTGLHRRLHTDLYYGIANALVISAYVASEDPVQQQRNIVLALGILRGIVAYLDSLSPY